MDKTEFQAVAPDLLTRLVPKLEAVDQPMADYAQRIRGAWQAGELTIALEDLTGALAKAGVAVSGEDKRMLRDIFATLVELAPEEGRERPQMYLREVNRIRVSG